MTKYVAKYNGAIVGKRKSDRVYTHAIIGIWDVEAARKAAYDYVANSSDKSNFRFYSEMAACEGKFFEPLRSWEKDKNIVGQTRYKGNPGQPMSALSHTAQDVAEAKKDTANGWDGYVAELRRKAIERFEACAAGGTHPYVVAWAGRPDLAQKRAQQVANDHANYQNTILLGVVPAEVV